MEIKTKFNIGDRCYWSKLSTNMNKYTTFYAIHSGIISKILCENNGELIVKYEILNYSDECLIPENVMFASANEVEKDITAQIVADKMTNIHPLPKKRNEDDFDEDDDDFDEDDDDDDNF